LSLAFVSAPRLRREGDEVSKTFSLVYNMPDRMCYLTNGCDKLGLGRLKSIDAARIHNIDRTKSKTLTLTTTAVRLPIPRVPPP